MQYFKKGKNNMKRVVKSSLALSLVFVMILTSGIIVNASDLQSVEKITDEDGNVTVQTTTSKTEYNSPTKDYIESLSSDIKAEPILQKDSVEELDAKNDTIKDDDSFFKSCRLIVTSREKLEFKESSIFKNDIVEVQQYENKYFVTYKTPEATEKAYNDLTSFGLTVEIDMVKETPEDVENKDDKSNDVKDKYIASTNDNDKKTIDLKDKDEEVQKDLNDSIIVAVLDTGLNNGEEIFDNRIIEGQNFVEDDKDYNDVNGHGTTTARLVLDTVNDTNKANQIKVMPIKVLNDEGKGTTLSAYKGIKYVIEQKKENPKLDFVINLSMSGIGESKLLKSAINEAYNNKIPVVVSAGNDDKDIKDYTPANIKSAFTIATAKLAENEQLEKEKYSNYGDGIDFATIGHYEYKRAINDKEVITKTDGTSVSTAYITSYIALLKQMAMSDEDDTNDDLGMTDINLSLQLSSIKSENETDKIYFGKGFVIKDKLTLIEERNKDMQYPVDSILDMDINEDIILTANGAMVYDRWVYVYGFHADTNWEFDVYETADSANPWDNKLQFAHAGNHINRYTEMGSHSADGGWLTAEVCEDNSTVKIHWINFDLSSTTTWFRAWLDLPANWEFDYTAPVPNWGNSDQDFIPQDQEVHYQADTLSRWVDVYMGIGFYNTDIAFHYKYVPQNIHVNYHAHGGTVMFLGQDQNKEVVMDVEYSPDGNTSFFNTSLGRGVTAKRDGYIFKGWYFSDRNDSSWENSPKHWLTDYIDYTNTYSDLYNSFAVYDYNMKDIGYHMYHAGKDEGRTHSEYKRSYNDYGNPIDGVYGKNPYDNFDNFRQLLSDGKGICGLDSVYGMFGWVNYPLEGQQIVAHAVWEKVPGFEVTWDTNGGKWTDGSTKDVTFSYSCSGQNELLPNYYVGIDANASPTKDGKVLKGWYFTYDDGTQRKVPLVTDMIDYYNRNSDLQPEGICTGFGMINMNALWRHWNDFGKGEHRQIAERARTLNDIDNKDSDYDYGNQLLKPGQCFCNTYVEGSYDLKNYKLRAYAIWGEDDGKRTITYNLNGAGARNDYRNPTSYTKEDNVTIYSLAAWHDNDYDYTFAGWKCDKNPPGNVNSAKNPSYSWTKKDYGDLVLTAQWNKTKRTKTSGSFDYNIIWDSNGNWQDGRNDTELKTYDHPTNTTWSWSSTSRWKDDEGWHSDHDSDSGDYDTQGTLATYETPDTPRTATLYFDDPNAHGNTSNISAPIKTKKRFDEWQKVKSTTLNPDKSRDYDRSGNGWSEYFHSYAGSTNYYYHSYYSGEGWSDSYTSRENERSTSKYYRADNPWKPNGKFRDLFNCCTETTLRAHWTRLPETLPSVSKPGYDFLGWQINGTGKIYRAGEQYTVGEDDNDVKFVAVWRRNQGKVVYNPNGAVNDYNQQYSPVTDNSYTMLNGSYTTKDGDIFGKEVTEDGFIKNETTKNKVGTTITNKYIINDGDIINTLGTKDKLSTFQGWSSINYARHDTPNILYNGYVSKFMNIYYDVTAVNKLKIANAPNPYTINNVITRANQIVTHRNNNISKWKATPKLSEIGDWFEKLTTSKLYYDPSLEGNGLVNMYATWDEFPAFTQVDDVSILSSDLSKGKDWIETRIMRDVVVTDKEYETKQRRLPYGELPHNVGKDKGKVGIE